MCGVIGLVVKQGAFSIDIFRRLLIESQIRGQHATGIAYEIDGKLHSVIEPLPAQEIKIPDAVQMTGIAIGHTRYSTSDLEYNQPIIQDEEALVLNGVVTQTSPEQWEDQYGVSCKGKNDAEILLQLWCTGQSARHPLLLEKSSQALILLDAGERTLCFWRNEERPLYYLENEKYLLVASTKDIFKRSMIEGVPVKCVPGIEYSYNLCGMDALQLRRTVIRQPKVDLQA